MADTLFEKETGIRVMPRRTGSQRVAPALPVSPHAADSRPPARVTSSHAANLEAELGRLSATSQQLTAENDRLKQLETTHAHEMEKIITALQRATGAAQSSRDRSESDKATIRRLETELASRTAAAPSPGFPPAAATPVSLAPAPRTDTATELRLGSSEVVSANLPATQATTPLPRDAGLSPPRSQVAPPPTFFRTSFPTLVTDDVSLAAARSCAELVQAAAQPATAARLLLLLQGEYREPAVAALLAAQHSVKSLLETAASADTPTDARVHLLRCLTVYHNQRSKQLDPVAEREALSKCLGILAEPEANADLQAAARSLMCTAQPEDIRDACVCVIRTACSPAKI